MSFHYKVGFIGAGNMSQAIIRGLIETKTLTADKIVCSNRTPGKLQKLTEQFGIQTRPTNEQVIDDCDVVILAMKPQDLATAVGSIASSFREKQVVISLAAGITFEKLEKQLPQCRLVRVIPNTPAVIQKGVTGYISNDDDEGAESMAEDLFSPLGYVIKVDDEEQLEALMVCCSSGVGFLFEFMMYFQDWIEERGFPEDVAKKMVIDTFVGASVLATQNKELPLEELQNKVASKKGVTAAGLESMRELEIERLLRYSFEKACLRNQELAKQN